MEELNINKKLRELNCNIDEKVLDFREKDFIYFATYIYMFNLEDYDRLVNILNQRRYTADNIQEKKSMIDDYKKVYNAKRVKLNRLLKNLKNGNLTLMYNEERDGSIDYLKNLIQSCYEYDDSMSPRDNINSFLEVKLKGRIFETNSIIHRLKYFPYEYINTLSTFIAPYNPSKYRSDLIFYKDVFICAKDNHHMGVYFNEDTLEETKRSILNILAYINAEPFFYFTDNPSFNRRLDELYKCFDLMDMVRIRKKDYFNSKIDEPFHIENPIIKEKKGFDFIEIKDVQYEMIFELYHASLKQFESLPRCVFLYRAFEYGNNFYYNTTFRPTNAKPETAINHLYNLTMNYRYMPLYYVDYGTYISEDDKIITKKRKIEYRNFILKLKSEARKIVHEWSQHSHLYNMSVGEVVYNTGRNASAHGGAQQHNARYDYSKNYKHINDVNIILELIVRYLIENMNPHIPKMVEHRKKYYIKYNRLEKLFE